MATTAIPPHLNGSALVSPAEPSGGTRGFFHAPPGAASMGAPIASQKSVAAPLPSTQAPIAAAARLPTTAAPAKVPAAQSDSQNAMIKQTKIPVDFRVTLTPADFARKDGYKFALHVPGLEEGGKLMIVRADLAGHSDGQQELGALICELPNPAHRTSYGVDAASAASKLLPQSAAYHVKVTSLLTPAQSPELVYEHGSDLKKLLSYSQKYGGVRTKEELGSNVVKMVDQYNGKETFRVPNNTPLGVYMAGNPTLFEHTRVGAIGEKYHYLEATPETIESAKKSLVEQLQPHTSQLLGSSALTIKFIPLNMKHTYGTDMNKVPGQDMAAVMSAPINACIHGNIWVATQ